MRRQPLVEAHQINQAHVGRPDGGIAPKPQERGVLGDLPHDSVAGGRRGCAHGRLSGCTISSHASPSKRARWSSPIDQSTRPLVLRRCPSGVGDSLVGTGLIEFRGGGVGQQTGVACQEQLAVRHFQVPKVFFGFFLCKASPAGPISPKQCAPSAADVDNVPSNATHTFQVEIRIEPDILPPLAIEVEDRAMIADDVYVVGRGAVDAVQANVDFLHRVADVAGPGRCAATRYRAAYRPVPDRRRHKMRRRSAARVQIPVTVEAGVGDAFIPGRHPSTDDPHLAVSANRHHPRHSGIDDWIEQRLRRR